MANLQRYDNEGLELIIDLETGESFATVSGYARMSNKDRSTIRERITKLKDRGKDLTKEAQIETTGGLQGCRLIPESLICEWLITDNPELAKQMITVGVRIYLHGLAGFKYEVKKQEPALDIDNLKNIFDQMLKESLKPQLDKIDDYNKACSENIGTGRVISSVVEKREYPDEVITTKEYCRKKRLDPTYWNTFSKRYAQFVRVGTGFEPPKYNGKLLIKDRLYFYANEALVSIIHEED